jgi:hypothetical protein
MQTRTPFKAHETGCTRAKWENYRKRRNHLESRTILEPVKEAPLDLPGLFSTFKTLKNPTAQWCRDSCHLQETGPVLCLQSFACQFHPHPRDQLARYFRVPPLLRDCILMGKRWGNSDWWSYGVSRLGRLPVQTHLKALFFFVLLLPPTRSNTQMLQHNHVASLLVPPY